MEKRLSGGITVLPRVGSLFLAKSHIVAINTRPGLRVMNRESAQSHFDGSQSGGG